MTDQPTNRRRRRWIIAALVVATPLAALAWWLGSPLFLNKTVDEAFPTAADATTLATGAGSTADPATTDDPAVSVEPDNSVASALPAEPDSPTVVEDAGDVFTPVLLQSGSVVGADNAHRGSGSASIYEVEDGTRVLRFEDFSVTNGPDLHVLVVPTAEPIDRSTLAEVGYTDLGKLKGNQGNQNYDLPADIDLSGPITVVVYCEPFHVVFASAQLAG